MQALEPTSTYLIELYRIADLSRAGLAWAKISTHMKQNLPQASAINRAIASHKEVDDNLSEMVEQQWRYKGKRASDKHSLLSYWPENVNALPDHALHHAAICLVASAYYAERLIYDGKMPRTLIEEVRQLKTQLDSKAARYNHIIDTYLS